MIRVLVVEDSDVKAAEVQEVISEAAGERSHVVIATNAHDAIRALRDQSFDLLIVDMKIPRRGDLPVDPLGGKLLLEQIQSRRDVRVPQHVLGLTAFDDVAEAVLPLFNDLTWALIRYQQGADHWRTRLAKKVEHIVNSQLSEREGDFDVDVALVTALDDPELAAVLSLGANWKPLRLDGDDTVYYRGQLARDGKVVELVVASALQMGMPACTALSMKLCTHFRPRYLGMAGICAGVDGAIGDILVADRSWDYGSGKSKGAVVAGSDKIVETFEPAPTAIPLDAELVEKFKAFKRRATTMSEIEARWTDERPKLRPSVRIGPIASGAAVLENRALIEQIRSHDRKLIGVEMEAYGVFFTSRVCLFPRPKAFVAKAVCDFADSRKADKFQRYAAFMSAQFIHDFAIEELSRTVLPQG
jgi:nucleoside phosphorylase